MPAKNTATTESIELQYGPHHTNVTEEPIFENEPPYEERDHDHVKKKYDQVHVQSRSRTADILPNYYDWASRKVAGHQLRQTWHTTFRALHNFVLRKRQIGPSPDGRHIVLGLDVAASLVDERTNRAYCSNLITSSVYTPYTFLPRQLYAQFSKLANLYFLFVSILQMIPSWSTTGSYTTIIPLLIFMSISMGREGFDDWRRHRQDKQENNRPTRIITAEAGDDVESDGRYRFKTVPWKAVRVGDIVYLKQNDWVPTDIVVLHSAGLNGLSYIETMDLDGETNLKSRLALPDLSKLCESQESLESLAARSSTVRITTEDPNLDLYNFEARVALDGTEYPLSSSHVVYRGSALRNTPYVLGLAVFTGEETKIRMNAIQEARTKAPRLQKRVNGIVVFMVCFVLGLSVFCIIAAKVYFSTTGSKMWFIDGLEVGTVPNLMGFIIMFNTLIPLSLYVSLEIIKVSQMLMLQKDVDMYHIESNTPCEARTATINEELGQVSYVFSDKTGTLTDNLMIFRKLSVGGVAWLHDLDFQLADQDQDQGTKLFHRVTSKKAAGKHVRKMGSMSSALEASRPSMDFSKQSLDVPGRKSGVVARYGRPSTTSALSAHSLRPTVSGHSSAWRSTANPARVQSTRPTLELLQYIMSHPNSLYARKAKFFILSIALCHSCLPDQNEDNDDPTNLKYSSASPDEVALVSAARDLGYVMVDRKHQTLVVRTYPKGFDQPSVDETYEVLETIEFSSSRKRMSAVVKMPDGRVCVMCKGADNIIIERLRQSKLALEKVQEISRQTKVRKTAEAEAVIARNSLSSVNGRPSMSKPRLSIGGVGRKSINIDRRDALASLETHFHQAKADVEVEQISESVRRSMTLARHKKYGAERASFDAGAGPSTVRSPTRAAGRRSEDSPAAAAAAAAAAAGVAAAAAAAADNDEFRADEHLVINDSYVLERTLEHIEEFSTEGLRTLLYGYRYLDRDEFAHWHKLYRDATTSLVDRQDKIEKVGEMIERDFELCGATAIEDKLQEGVPETIDKLRRAGIKLWMLTGDKRETAINIGYSCRLIKDYSTVVILRSDEGDVANKMATAMLALDGENGGGVAHCVVVVDGMTLAQIEQDMTLMTLFVDLGVKADSVICCRASPAQKASMVSAVRRKVKSAITLAIGDGANDIAMIRSADVGIGITGKEGLQAARSSDYSIAQFRFLIKLLLVHGRWNYVRTCKYVLGTFYKEFLFYLTQAIFQRNTMFTGTSIYESWSLSMFNTLFTSLPVLCLGIFERDLRPATLVAVPELYAVGQKNQSFSLVLFLGWMIVASSQSTMLSFCVYYLYGFSALKDNTLYPLGTLSFTICLFVICTKINLIEMHSITVINVIVLVVSLGGWFVWSMFLSFVYSRSPSKIYFVQDALFDRFGRDASWWSTLLFAYVACAVLDLIVQCMRRQALPTDTEIFQQLEKDPDVKRKFEEEAQYELQLSSERTHWESDWRFLSGALGRRSVESVAESGSAPSVEEGTVATSTDYDGRQGILKRLRFKHRKTSGEYEREIEEILERRQRQLEN